MTLKTVYQKFCERQEDMPVFVQPWYLDAVCGPENWGVVLARKGHTITGSMPYYIRKKGFFRYITMPPLTKFMGPYIPPAFRSLSQEHRILSELIGLLPRVDYFNQNFHYQLANWLPFYWKGYTQTTNYSYLLKDLSDLDEVYGNFRTDYRNNKIPKARAVVEVADDLSAETFFRVKKMSFERQGLAHPYSFEFFKQVDDAVVARNRRKLFFGVDKKGNVHAVLYLLWDDTTAYYHLAGDDPAFRKSGAGILLIWEAIQYTRNVLGLNSFDFEGSMLQPIERVRRQFGGIQAPYFNISKYHSRLFAILSWLKSS